MITHRFTNLSGVEYEVTELNAKHQRIISEDGAMNINQFDEVLSDVIVKVGSTNVANLSDDARFAFIKKLPSDDRRKALFEARQLTNDFNNDFYFKFQYESAQKHIKGTKLEEWIQVNVSNVILERPYLNPVEEIDQFVFDYEGIFPRSGEQYKFTLSNGFSEELKLGKASSHTPILLRQPKLKKTVNKHGEPLKEPVWLMMNSDTLDKLSTKDIEHLRKHIHDTEALFDSSISFPHPEAEYLPMNERRVRMDLLSVPAFYFPSGVI